MIVLVTTRLHTTISGSGPTIVLLHGFLSSSQYFKTLGRQLARDQRVIAIDLLGHGKSPRSTNRDYSFEAQLAALEATLADFDHFTLLGHSMGTLLAMRYASAHQDQIDHLILINPPMFASYEQARESIVDTGRFYRAMMFSRYRRLLWRGLKLTPRFAHGRRPVVSSSDLLKVPHTARDQSLHDIIMPTNFFDEIEPLAVPTLVIVGERDRTVYRENLRDWQAPSHVTLRFNRHGHHFIARHPEAAECEIRQFLDR